MNGYFLVVWQEKTKITTKQIQGGLVMLFRKLGITIVLLCTFSFNAYAENTYKYKDVCPNPAGGNEYVDDWGFYKCECTSYVAFKLNEAGIPFRNHYKGVHWGYASNWKSAAEGAGVPTYNSPKPGDVAWWSGHVAYVERVDYDSNGNWEKMWISEYNYDPPYGHDYGTKHGPFRNFTPQDSNKPTKYIRLKPNLSDDSEPKELNARVVDQYAWYPPNVDCQDAEIWFEILSDRCILRDISICQKIQGTCSAQE